MRWYLALLLLGLSGCGLAGSTGGGSGSGGHGGTSAGPTTGGAPGVTNGPTGSGGAPSGSTTDATGSTASSSSEASSASAGPSTSSSQAASSSTGNPGCTVGSCGPCQKCTGGVCETVNAGEASDDCHDDVGCFSDLCACNSSQQCKIAAGHGHCKCPNECASGVCDGNTVACHGSNSHNCD